MMIPRSFGGAAMHALARRVVADVLATVPSWSQDRRKLGEYLRAHPGPTASSVDARMIRQAGQAFTEVADAMEGKPLATDEPL